MLNRETFLQSSLCVVGNINRDVKTALLHAGPHLLADGESSVSSITETIGGGGANSAFAAAKLGARVSFAGKIGKDELGVRLERKLMEHGIKPYLSTDETCATGTSLALSYDSGHRHFISCLPASRALAFPDIDLSMLENCAHLLRADIWFAESMLYEGNKALFQAAQARGLAVSVDLNWDPYWGRAGAEEIRARKNAVRAILPLVDLAHGNARELMEFSDAADLETALKRLADWGVRAVLVHLGEKGAGYFNGTSLLVEPAVPAQAHVNTTGTGDVLSVCMMLLHQHKDIPMRERLHLANGIVSEFIAGRLLLIPTLDGFPLHEH